MTVIVAKDYEDMSKKAVSIIAEAIKENPNGLISFPGGDTPTGMYEEFVKLVNKGEIDISNLKYVSLDEWVGLSENDKGSCAHYNRTHLFDKLEKKFADVFVINGAADDINEECKRLDSFIEKYGPLTVSVLGIGLNGHLGFNEEGVNFGSNAHIIPLSQTTLGVMSKYFGDNFHPEYGITQGIAQIMNAKTVILLANGSKKAEIIEKTMNCKISNAVPASILRKHPNCDFIIDELAAERL